jgi:callose synthase
MKRAKVVEEKSGHFRSYKYNIVPLSFPASSEAVLELPEVSYSLFALSVSTLYENPQQVMIIFVL